MQKTLIETFHRGCNSIELWKITAPFSTVVYRIKYANSPRWVCNSGTKAAAEVAATLWTADGRSRPMIQYQEIPESMPAWHELRKRADRVRAMVYARARQASIDAGLGEIGCQLHNSLVDLSYGKPWRGVNYSKARLARRLLGQRGNANRILDRLYSKYGPDLIVRHKV